MIKKKKDELGGESLGALLHDLLTWRKSFIEEPSVLLLKGASYHDLEKIKSLLTEGFFRGVSILPIIIDVIALVRGAYSHNQAQTKLFSFILSKSMVILGFVTIVRVSLFSMNTHAANGLYLQFDALLVLSSFVLFNYMIGKAKESLPRHWAACNVMTNEFYEILKLKIEVESQALLQLNCQSEDPEPSVNELIQSQKKLVQLELSSGENLTREKRAVIDLWIQEREAFTEVNCKKFDEFLPVFDLVAIGLGSFALLLAPLFSSCLLFGDELVL